MFWKSDLHRALTSWLRNGGSLQKRIPRRDGRVRSESEAKLVCAALDKALSEAPIEEYTQASYNLGAVIGQFQSVDSEPAAALLETRWTSMPSTAAGSCRPTRIHAPRPSIRRQLAGSCQSGTRSFACEARKSFASPLRVASSVRVIVGFQPRLKGFSIARTKEHGV